MAGFGAGGGGLPSLKDELTIAASRVTPGVDDTPYIQYAIEALTREHGTSPSLPPGYHFHSGTSGASSSLPPQQTRQQQQQQQQEQLISQPLTPPQTAHLEDAPLEEYDDEEDEYDDERSHVSRHSIDLRQALLEGPAEVKGPKKDTKFALPSVRPIDEDQDTTGPWVPVTKDMLRSLDPHGNTYTPLTYKPLLLRPFSMIILILLCVLMMIGLIFSAVYASTHVGLTPYPGTIYSGQYFVFRILPQLLAACIFLFAQGIVAASVRILPFTSMASEDPQDRYLALFQPLSLTGFLWPRVRKGPWQFTLFSVAAWLMCFTIPLQSALFTCVFDGFGYWNWTTTYGVAWTLVVLYALLALSTATLMTFWFRQWTGLMWDIRSIADVVALLHQSNAVDGYFNVDHLAGMEDKKSQMRNSWFNRLGYWRTQDMITGGIWYTVGIPFAKVGGGNKATKNAIGKIQSHDASLMTRDLAVPTNLGGNHFRYLPWQLRTPSLVAFVAVAVSLMVPLLVASFLPQTKLESGFLPKLPSQPNSGHFSSANFLYGFLPSLLGMVVFLLFQHLDLTLRALQPWGELNKPEGGRASASILADYTACAPLQVTWQAAHNGHWRLAFVSLVGTLSIFLPILAGGLFMALTPPRGTVRMYPSTPLFGLIITLLLLCLIALISLIPSRRQFMLPHSLTCLADVISLCSAEDLTTDAAFREVRSRGELKTRLGVHPRATPREESTWLFGGVPGRDERVASVRRARRFTEKTTLGRFSRSMTSMV